MTLSKNWRIVSCIQPTPELSPLQARYEAAVRVYERAKIEQVAAYQAQVKATEHLLWASAAVDRAHAQLSCLLPVGEY